MVMGIPHLILVNDLLATEIYILWRLNINVLAKVP